MGQSVLVFGDTYDLWVVSTSLIRNSNQNSEFGSYCPGNAKYDSFLNIYPVTAYYDTVRRYDCVILEQLNYRNYATIVLGIWSIFQCAYFMVSQGFFGSRYHVFDKIH
tara:strand:+ start:729 stop:1052 length:324 start_codon:yes stop_codon:yes gene_type:complete